MEYGLIGHPLGHSFSVEIHSLIGNYNYHAVDLQPNDLATFFTKKQFKGINVTIPYKKAVIPYLDFLSEEAKKIGSVNTVVNRNGKLYGYNTDIFGFEDLLKSNSISVSEKKVIILGNGGSAATVNYYCTKENASEIITVSRSESNKTVSYNDAINYHNNADIIINTTPVGMYPDSLSSPLDISCFTNVSAIVDIVYNPLRTALTVSAENKGIANCNGLYMLVAQAVHSASLFFDDFTLIEKCDSIFHNIQKKKRNIVFIGMPTSGKSTIGKLISEELNVAFYDTDVIIEKQMGCSVSEIFATVGEIEFRKLESDLIANLSAYSGTVISTGGGAILNSNNIDLLRQNGFIVFLDKAPAKLSADTSRPLASSKEDIYKLYRERIAIYRNSADVTVDANGTITETLNKLKEILNNENLHNQRT